MRPGLLAQTFDIPPGLLSLLQLDRLEWAERDIARQIGREVRRFRSYTESVKLGSRTDPPFSDPQIGPRIAGQ